jgi:A/G-specific adenine glycosylase
MLQQTRVDTVIPYYTRWMVRFPDLPALAAASEQDVLLLWEGLGYYSRARNILLCAKLLVKEYAGQLPKEIKELKALPGIGDYISGAIASIAFQIKAPALDGNIKRVLARLTNFRQPVNIPKSAVILRETLMQLLPNDVPGDFNQALMDLGSEICFALNPACTLCPLKADCMAFGLGNQNDLPVKVKKAAVPHYQVAAAVIVVQDKTLIDKRDRRGLLGGLWEFPGGKVEPGETLPQALARELMEEMGVKISVGELLGSYRHAYTHFKVTVHAFSAAIITGEARPLAAEQIEWALIKDLDTYPMGKVDRLIARALQEKTIYGVM